MTQASARTRWGGIAGSFPASGFFRVTQSDGVWWLADPDGGRFLSKGVNTVWFGQDEIQGTQRVPYADTCARKYGSIEVWRAAAARRLAGWGFNTLGSWSDMGVATAGPPLASTPNLDLAMSFAWEWNDRHRDLPRMEFPDVFDPDFETHIRRRAQENCAVHADAPHILGWFIDNELRWGSDWRGNDPLLKLFLNHTPDSPGRNTANEFVRSRGGDAAALTVDGADAFAALVGERYFALTVAAIKAADPNHLVLGCRFALPPPASAVAAAGRHLDVLTFNCYEEDPGAVIPGYAVSGRPCLIGEFAFRGDDAGLPNTRGAGPRVATQRERSQSYRRYVSAALRHPAIVGTHWFEHADQPAEGRFDGENSNYGTVDINDEVYAELTAAMTAVNAEAEALHAGEALQA